MESINATLSNVDWETFGAATWAFANQPIVCALLPTTIAAILAQRVNVVVQQNLASLDAIRATASAQDQLDVEGGGEPQDGIVAEAAPPAAESGTSPSTRAPPLEDGARRLALGAALIKSLKDYVERTAQGIRDGRRRRKYNNLPRHDYRVWVLALAEDGAISNEDASQLNHAFALWRRFKTGKVPVPEFVISELKSIERQYSHRASSPSG